MCKVWSARQGRGPGSRAHGALRASSCLTPAPSELSTGFTCAFGLSHGEYLSFLKRILKIMQHIVRI